MADSSDNPKLQVIIELIKKGDTNGAIQELKALKDTSDNTSSSLDKLLGVAKETFAAIASVAFIKSAIEAATQYDRTIAALNGTLKATGQYSTDYVDFLKAQRKELSETTSATGGQVAAIQTLLISFGATKQDLPALTKGALDLATVMGTDGLSAALALAKALEGQDTTLTRLGFHFDQNAGYTERLASLMDQLKSRVGGASEEFNKMPVGKVEELAKAWGGFKKEVGESSAYVLAPVFSGLAKLLHSGFGLSNEDILPGPGDPIPGSPSYKRFHGAEEGPFAGMQFDPAATAPTTPNAVQIQASKQAIDDLKQHFQDAMNAGMATAEKMRADAAAVYQQDLQFIADRQRKGELSASAVEQAYEAATMKREAGEEKADEVERQKKMEIAALESQLQAQGLTGLQKAIAEETARYDMEKRKILENTQLAVDEKTKLLQLNDAAHQAAIKAQDQIVPTDKLQLLEQQLTVATQGASETRLAAINREFRSRIQAYQQLLSTHQITENKMTELTKQAEQMRMQALAAVATQGEVEIERTNLSTRQFELKQIEEEYNKRIDLVNAYYEFEIQKAKDNQEEIDYLENEKTYTVEKMEQQKQFAISNTGNLIDTVGKRGEELFAQGLSGAIVDFISGTKTAEEAFKQFAASFLQEIAKMILETEILNALKSFNLFGGGGQAYAPAATGIQVIAAASGVAGVSSVSSPTYFPKFNVLAGEAGEEALTVLSKPHMVNWNGVVAQLGNVGSNRLAIVNADTLQALVQARGARAAANGTGPNLPASSNGGGAGGRAEVVVRLEDGLKAEIIANSIQGAKVAVTKDLGQQTAISAAVKKLTA